MLNTLGGWLAETFPNATIFDFMAAYFVITLIAITVNTWCTWHLVSEVARVLLVEIKRLRAEVGVKTDGEEGRE